MWDFLTKELALDPSRLYFTCYSGNSSLGIPRDEESAQLWKSLLEQSGVSVTIVEDAEEKGMRGGRIFTMATRRIGGRELVCRRICPVVNQAVRIRKCFGILANIGVFTRHRSGRMLLAM